MQTNASNNNSFLGLCSDPERLKKAKVIILPVPFEKTSTFGSGSTLGPEAIISASHQVELCDCRIGISPYKKHGIATLQPLAQNSHDGCQVSKIIEKEVSHWLNLGKQVITLGGEHTSVVGAIKAHTEHYRDTTVLQLDAHSDLRASYQGDPWNHACTISRVLDFHPRIVQVGIRSECEEDHESARKNSLSTFYAEQIYDQERDGIDWVQEVVTKTTQQVYITLDCDVFDPAVIPATGTPEPGGLSWHQIDRLIRTLAHERRIVGFDISELSPIPGLIHPQFTIAKLVYRLIGYTCTNNHQDTLSFRRHES